MDESKVGLVTKLLHIGVLLIVLFEFSFGVPTAEIGLFDDNVDD